MTVTVTIPLSRLEDPQVNTALRVLLDAVARRLSAQDGAQASASILAPTGAPPMVSTQVAGRVEASPSPTALEYSAQIAAPLAAPVPQASKASPPAAAALAPAAPAPAAPAPTAEDWTRFVKGLPERTQRFLALVQDKGLLTIDEAMALLGISEPKALGGITGAIGRWVPQRGFAMPYETLSIGGRRAWRWLNANGPSATVPAAESKPAVAAPKPAATAPKSAAATSKPAVAEVAQATPKAAASQDAYSAYRSAPQAQAVKPVATPAAREPVVAAPPAVHARPAAVHIPAAAPKAAAPVAAPKAAPKAAAPVVAPVAAPVAAPKAAAPVASPMAAGSGDTAAFTARIVALLTELPENSRRFLGLLDERGRLTMDEVLSEFGLDRPKAAGRIVEPIDRLFRSHGLDLPYDKDRGEDGRRIWLRKNLFG